VLCGEGRVKARVHVSFFRSASRRAPRVSPTFRKGGEDKVKAKNENSLMRAYTRAREENRGEVFPKQDLFSSIVLVFRAEQVEISIV